MLLALLSRMEPGKSPCRSSLLNGTAAMRRMVALMSALLASSAPRDLTEPSKIPQNAEAMVGLAYARALYHLRGWSTAAEDSYAAQLDLLTKATAINPGYAFAYYVKSLPLFFTKQFPEAIEAAQTAVALDPNAAWVFRDGPGGDPFGRCEQSIAHIKQAFALSPRDPVGGFWHTYLGVTEVCLGRLDAAIAEFKRAIDAGTRTHFPYAYLAGAEAAKGNDAEAKLALAEARRLNPQLTIKSFAETYR